MSENGQRAWCWTLNNYTDADVVKLNSLQADGESARRGCHLYLVYGKEVGTGGTPHLQGFIYFKSPKQRRQVVAYLGEPGLRMHLEAKGKWSTVKQAADYCKKDGDFHESGAQPAGQGCRTDIANFLAVATTHNDLEAAEEFPEQYAKYHTAFSKLQFHAAKERTTKTEVWWLWGPTGTGKSHFANEIGKASGLGVYRKPPNTKWWDGYNHEKFVIMDEFRGDWWGDHTFRMLLVLFDKYGLSVEVKGGTRQFVAEKIYVTSCKHWRTMFEGQGEALGQLERRIEHTMLFNERFEERRPHDDQVFGGHEDPERDEPADPLWAQRADDWPQAGNEDFGEIFPFEDLEMDMSFLN
jgi:hypothetical protein